MIRYDFDLGPWSRKIATVSESAGLWFDRGLNWTFAYNHEEAVQCFRRAIREDPTCAMAWWGVAYAAGPFYNRPWIRHSDAEIAKTVPVCHAAIEKALALAGNALPVEQALIAALSKRYQNSKTRDRGVLNSWHAEYANAMRGVYAAFGDNPDIAALYVEAAVTCTPRQLWNLKSGAPNPTSRMTEVLPVLEDWMARIAKDGPVHPGIAHMYIHALEMSPFPQRALKAADMLVGYAPDAGHLEHMAAHIYVLCGDYPQAVAQSARAVRADDKYLDFAGDQNFYTTARCHDLHLYMFAGMLLGQFDKAMYAADRICSMATPDLIAVSPPFMASILDGYAAMQIHVLVRFGRWQSLVDSPCPEDPVLRPIGTAMHAYGQGVAHSALGNVAEAECAQVRFREAVYAIPDGAIFLSNTLQDMLAVGDAMLAGELEYRKGNHEVAFENLRLAVERDDALNYTEPWAWMHPPRHALGALLAEQGRFDEAERVFRADLGLTEDLQRCSQHPDNIWALKGLVECVEEAGQCGELSALRLRLELAEARADPSIKNACFCRGM